MLAWLADSGVTSTTGRDLFAPAGEREAVSVYSRGFRIDRGGFTLLVDSNDPNVPYAFRSFSGSAPAPMPLAQTPFAPDEPARLTARLQYWSKLVEQDRVWNDSLARHSR